MIDKVYPTAKAATTNGGTTVTPTKNHHLYNPTRPQRRRGCSGRRFCCLCFIYTLITLLSLLLISGITSCIFYALYHPKYPSFDVTTLRITTTTAVSRLSLGLSVTNPNTKRISFVYDPLYVVASIASSDDVITAGNATVPGFSQGQKNTTILQVAINNKLDTAGKLKGELSNKAGFPVSVDINTKVRVRIGKLTTKRFGIRVKCDGIRGFQPKKGKAKNSALGNTTGAKCKADLRIKIWKFTF